MLQANRCSYVERSAKHIHLRSITATTAHYPQFTRPETQEIHHLQARHHLGQCTAHCGTHHAQAHAGNCHVHSQHVVASGLKDKQKIKQHIQPAHQYAQHTRHLHIATASKHTGRQYVEFQKRQAEHQYQEILRRMWRYRGTSSKPVRQPKTYQPTHHRKQRAHYQAHHYRLTQHATCVTTSVRAYQVSYLNRESGRQRRTQASKQPQSGRY